MDIFSVAISLDSVFLYLRYITPEVFFIYLAIYFVRTFHKKDFRREFLDFNFSICRIIVDLANP